VDGDALKERLWVLIACQAGYAFGGWLFGAEDVMENLKLAFLLVAVILAALAAIPPLPYSQQLLAGAVAFLAAGHLVP
jgi:hypothetical protein